MSFLLVLLSLYSLVWMSLHIPKIELKILWICEEGLW
jgi:hypothetical protein